MPVGSGSLKRAVNTTKSSDIVSLPTNNIVEIDISSLDYKSGKADIEMVNFIKDFGVILPVVVAKKGDKFTVIDGAKRLDALKELKHTKVKAVVFEGNADKLTQAFSKMAKAKKPTADDVHEEKFKAVERLCSSELPFYLL